MSYLFYSRALFIDPQRHGRTLFGEVRESRRDLRGHARFYGVF